jgi:hypothetical protein
MEAAAFGRCDVAAELVLSGADIFAESQVRTHGALAWKPSAAAERSRFATPSRSRLSMRTACDQRRERLLLTPVLAITFVLHAGRNERVVVRHELDIQVQRVTRLHMGRRGRSAKRQLAPSRCHVYHRPMHRDGIAIIILGPKRGLC